LLAATHFVFLMMSEKQRVFYFTLWNRVMVEKGWYHRPADEKRAKRLALHMQAGCIDPETRDPKSSKAFSNSDFNRFKTHCEALLAGRNSPGPGKADADDARRRLVWRIKSDARKAGLDAAYIVAVARDLAVLGNWEDLDIPGLTNLMHTIHNRAGAKCGHDTRNVPHVRHYTMDAVPRMFRPLAGAHASSVQSGASCHAIPSDNEPF